MTVKFKMPHTLGSLYGTGEIAGFEKDVEADLIERKIADAYKPTKAVEPKPVEPTPAA